VVRWRRVRRCYHLEVIPHANVQQQLHEPLAAVSPNVPMVEYCCESLADLLEESIRVVHGFYNLPAEPGLGVKLSSHAG
jgi:L-alanine-DL-glutamate epimerase-like enolase superfamily enzyme